MGQRQSSLLLSVMKNCDQSGSPRPCRAEGSIPPAVERQSQSGFIGGDHWYRLGHHVGQGAGQLPMMGILVTPSPVLVGPMVTESCVKARLDCATQETRGVQTTWGRVKEGSRVTE